MGTQNYTNIDFSFERISDAFISFDNDWNYVYANKHALNFHNKNLEDLIGKCIWDLYPGLIGGEFNTTLLNAKETQASHSIEIYDTINEKWYHNTIYPSSEGVSVYYNDITHKKKSEFELKKMLDKLHSHLNNTPLAVMEFDSDLNIIQWSKKAEEMFGWDSEEAMQLQFGMNQIIHKDDIFDFYGTLGNVSSVGSLHKSINIKCNTKQNAIIYCEWYISFINLEDNSSVMLALVDNITERKLVEFELINAESKFRGLVEQSMVGVFIRKEEKFIYVNPRFAEIFGYTQNEMCTEMTVFEIFSESDTHKFKTQLADYSSKKIFKHHYEFKGVQKNGQYIYLEVFGNTAIYNNEEVTIGSIIDITVRKKSVEKLKISRDALKLSNEKFELVAKATNDAIWDWDIKTDTLTGNDVFCGLFDVPPNTAISFSDFLNRVDENERETLVANFNYAVKNKISLLTEEFTFKQNNGKYKLIKDRAFVLYDKNQQEYRVLGAMQDITEVKEASQKITAEKDLSDNIINSMPGTFYLFNAAGKYKRWNKNYEDITGYTTEEILNQTALDLLVPEDVEMVKDKIAELFVTKKQTSLEATFIVKSGEKLRYFLTGRYIKYENEDCIIGVGIDTSEKKLAEDKLKKSEKNYRDLASNLEKIRENERTHMAREIHDELGQQLTGLKMDISWINKKVKSDDIAVQERMKDTIALIDKTVVTVRRLATQLRPSILDDLGLISAMEWQSQEFEKRNEIKSTFKANVAHVAVSTNIATGVFRIYQECLTNVSRHSKATQVNSELIIENNLLTLNIVDNGIGFNHSEIRSKKTLGLLGMKERALLINGTYKIIGNSGKGTSIKICIPLETSIIN
ncbi:MAG: PAS domain S-box protein [Ferruginibacter sp.]|nr:PAS domain S-box protein [Ferruginibacter sp.]